MGTTSDTRWHRRHLMCGRRPRTPCTYPILSQLLRIWVPNGRVLADEAGIFLYKSYRDRCMESMHTSVRQSGLRLQLAQTYCVSNMYTRSQELHGEHIRQSACDVHHSCSYHSRFHPPAAPVMVALAPTMHRNLRCMVLNSTGHININSRTC